MGSYFVDAIIMSRRDVGEADRLLTIFSRTLGKQKVIAKGARRLTSRMGAHLEPGRRSKLFLVERRSWHLITQAETQHVFINAPTDLPAMQDAFQILEAVSSLLEDGQRDSRLFDLVLESLRVLSQTRDTRRRLVVCAFIVKALKMMGLEINIHRCVVCSREIIGDKSLTISAARGGIAHLNCASISPGTFKISIEALELLQQLVQTKLATIEQPLNGDLVTELHRPLVAFVEWASERTLKSALI